MLLPLATSIDRVPPSFPTSEGVRNPAGGWIGLDDVSDVVSSRSTAGYVSEAPDPNSEGMAFVGERVTIIP